MDEPRHPQRQEPQRGPVNDHGLTITITESSTTSSSNSNCLSSAHSSRYTTTTTTASGSCGFVGFGLWREMSGVSLCLDLSYPIASFENGFGGSGGGGSGGGLFVLQVVAEIPPC